MIKLRTIAGVAIFLGLSISVGCNGYISEHPLSEERDSPPDVRLVGTWKLLHPKPGPHDATIVVSRAKPDSNRLLVELGDRQKGEFTTTKIGDVEAMSVRLNRTQLYLFFRYEIRDDCVGLWMVNNAVFAEGIGKGELKKGSEPILEDRTEDLRKFIEAHGKECFRSPESDGGPTVYHRASAKAAE